MNRELLIQKLEVLQRKTLDSYTEGRYLFFIDCMRKFAIDATINDIREIDGVLIYKIPDTSFRFVYDSDGNCYISRTCINGCMNSLCNRSIEGKHLLKLLKAADYARYNPCRKTLEFVLAYLCGVLFAVMLIFVLWSIVHPSVGYR